MVMNDTDHKSYLQRVNFKLNRTKNELASDYVVSTLRVRASTLSTSRTTWVIQHQSSEQQSVDVRKNENIRVGHNHDHVANRQWLDPIPSLCVRGAPLCSDLENKSRRIVVAEELY